MLNPLMPFNHHLVLVPLSYYANRLKADYCMPDLITLENALSLYFLLITDMNYMM